MSPMKPVELRGWKSIAQYLQVARSTAALWSTQGMPVHTYGKGKRAVVWALTLELDEWKASRRRETGKIRVLAA